MAALAARTCAAVDSAARTIMSSSFSRLSPPAFAMMSILSTARYVPAWVHLGPRRVPCNKRTSADFAALYGPNLPQCVSKLTLSSAARLAESRRCEQPGSVQLSKENNGEGRAGRTGSADGIAAPRKQGAAARGTLESPVLRRYRHADRGRRDLVLSEDADRPAGFGQI